MTPITEFAARSALMQATASRIAHALNQAISENGEACAALSGGVTPEPAYRDLGLMPVDWPKVTFLLVDERFVPPANEASNESMLRRALATPLAAGARLIPMFAENATLEEAAVRAEAAHSRQRIDIAVMGMGNDGHTASWFPQAPELKAALDLTNPRTVMPIHAPGASGSAERLTLTRSAIAKAGEALLLIVGADKRELLQDPHPPLPVDTLFDPPPPTETLWAP
ncbi:MAG: 6-phosphogluconolactonase [Caulobacteraceae bacterium]